MEAFAIPFLRFVGVLRRWWRPPTCSSAPPPAALRGARRPARHRRRPSCWPWRRSRAPSSARRTRRRRARGIEAGSAGGLHHIRHPALPHARECARGRPLDHGARCSPAGARRLPPARGGRSYWARREIAGGDAVMISAARRRAPSPSAARRSAASGERGALARARAPAGAALPIQDAINAQLRSELDATIAVAAVSLRRGDGRHASAPAARARREAPRPRIELAGGGRGGGAGSAAGPARSTFLPSSR